MNLQFLFIMTNRIPNTFGTKIREMTFPAGFCLYSNMATTTICKSKICTTVPNSTRLDPSETRWNGKTAEQSPFGVLTLTFQKLVRRSKSECDKREKSELVERDHSNFLQVILRRRSHSVLAVCGVEDVAACSPGRVRQLLRDGS